MRTITKALVSVAALASLMTLSACGSSTTTDAADASDGAHQGGTLHLAAQSAGGTLDPQVNYTLQYWQLYQGAYDGLLTYARVGGTKSEDIVPDLATAMPTISPDGKTYTFELRKDIKFSNGKTLTTDDVVASFRRLFKVSSPNAGSWYNVIVGADACLKTPATCTLNGGIVADSSAGTITFHLTQSDPEFEAQLAMPFASVLPADTAPKDAGTTPIPTTGPYYFASYSPNKALVMKRNRYFHSWSKEAAPVGYPDEIDETFGLTAEAEVTAVENGQSDWMYDTPPSDRLSEISTKYASQVHVTPLTAMWYLALNTNIAPFNNESARQAINWAVDRAAIVKLYGGSSLAAPACTILPPDFPGHKDFCDYTKGGGSTWSAPDLTKAKQLVQQSGTAGQSVGVVVQNDSVNKGIGLYLVSLLNQLGYKATIKPLSNNIQYNYIQNTKNHVQLSLTQWYQDYPAASDFLQVLLSCSSFHPNSDSSINIAGYCNRDLDAKMTAADAKGLTDQTAANAQWGDIDQQYMALSPLVPLFNPKLIDFTSSRVKNYQFSDQYYMLVDQLWLK
ncbi:ABC transporter substrate-binding protein [Humibacter ginsenosidimutans]|uniref:ABC transporter substrate-binding protein n=1 Tax=Humibacter ginsenosidimutans TaxID=2599293 RepID=A0A5B8M489_9MICO|nr:ABC transporter substrate-binding protein [Humibacter ginsenosidimutans]QDZ15387.1 ABC transporter substrate-binding protein [Humibacter ginsenosidimutans]